MTVTSASRIGDPAPERAAINGGEQTGGDPTFANAQATVMLRRFRPFAVTEKLAGCDLEQPRRLRGRAVNLPFILKEKRPAVAHQHADLPALYVHSAHLGLQPGRTCSVNPRYKLNVAQKHPDISEPVVAAPDYAGDAIAQRKGIAMPSLAQLTVWIVMGLLGGSLAGLLITRERKGFGLVRNMALGLAGAIVGGLLFRLLGLLPGLDAISISLRDVTAAFVGSLIVLAAIWLWQRFAKS